MHYRSNLSPAAISRSVLVAGVILFGSFLAHGCGTGGKAQEKPAEVPRNVRVLEIKTTDLREYVSISGTAHPSRGTDLQAEESGQVAQIASDKGTVVRAGQPIVVLDRRLLEAEMQSAIANRDLGAFNAERMRKLFDAKSISEIEMRQTETQMAQLSAAADAARIRYERAATLAPYEGVIAERYVELGQMVNPGMRIARIVDPYVLKLAGGVSEREVRAIAKGKPAEIAFEGVDGVVEGHVHWVGLEADPITGKFGVEIRVENPRLAVRPGVVGHARVLKETHEDVIVIPRDAVLQKAAGPTVFVVEDGIARSRRIALGPDQGLLVMVRDGLKVGDRLVVRGHRDVHDGSAVSVQEVANRPDGTNATDPRETTQGGTVSETWETQPTPAGESQ